MTTIKIQKKFSEKRKRVFRRAGEKAKKIRAVIFDFDDTLVESKEEALIRHRLAAEKAGVFFDEKTFMGYYGGAWPDFLEKIYGRNTQKFLDAFRSFGEFSGIRIDGADKTLKTLFSKNILLGITTSCNRPVLDRRLKTELGCDELFEPDMIITKEDVKHHKPSKGAFSSTLSYLKEKGINKDEVVYCGDLLTDLWFARNSGVGFIAVTTGPCSRKDFLNEGLEPEMIIPSVKCLPEKLEKLSLI